MRDFSHDNRLPWTHRSQNLSTPLFEGIPEDMTEEEIALSQSTPGFQMG